MKNSALTVIKARAALSWSFPRPCGRKSPDAQKMTKYINMKPLCEPPFPLERIEEMTALMGGDGRMR